MDKSNLNLNLTGLIQLLFFQIEQLFYVPEHYDSLKIIWFFLERKSAQYIIAPERKPEKLLHISEAELSIKLGVGCRRIANLSTCLRGSKPGKASKG